MPKAFQAQASKPFNERQNALLEVLRRARERKQRERQAFQLPQVPKDPPEGSPDPPKTPPESPPAQLSPKAKSTPPSTFLHFLAAATDDSGVNKQPAALPASRAEAASRQNADKAVGPIMLSIADEQGVSGLMPQFVISLQKVAPQLAASLVVICVTPEAYQACTDSVAHVTCFLDAQVRSQACV